MKVSVMTGKLKDIDAINTNTLTNEFCQKMQKTDSICKKCYSQKMLEGIRKNCAPAWQRNSDELSGGMIPPHMLPSIYTDVFRFNGHGELINDIHFQNIIMIARKNPNTFFVLWTKRKAIVNRVLKTWVLPKNLSLIFSNPKIDKPMKSVPRHFDKVFNNVSKGSDYKINCHQKCRDCMLCYTRNDVTQILEEVK